MTNARELAMQELREKIKGNILAIREDIKNAGFDTSYIEILLFEEPVSIKAYFTNGVQVKSEDRLDFVYTIKEMEQ